MKILLVVFLDDKRVVHKQTFNPAYYANILFDFEKRSPLSRCSIVIMLLTTDKLLLIFEY